MPGLFCYAVFASTDYDSGCLLMLFVGLLYNVALLGVIIGDLLVACFMCYLLFMGVVVVSVLVVPQ